MLSSAMRKNSHSPSREPSDEDFRAAEAVLARQMPSLERSVPEYAEERRKFAELHAEMDKDRFELRYGLRPPRSAIEQAEVDCNQGRITEDRFREMLKADAERPIDVAMLDAFRAAYEERLMAYSRMLQAVIAIATDQRDHDAWRRREVEVDGYVEAMEAKLPLRKEQVATVFTFLAELQADRKGEPVRCEDRSAESAHMLASRVMDHAAAAWSSCKEIAQRSRTDPSYLYPTSASHLFHSSHLPGLPRPQELQSLMVLEHVRARKALQERAQAAKINPQTESAAPIPVRIANLNESIDRLSKSFDQYVAKMDDFAAQAAKAPPPLADPKTTKPAKNVYCRVVERSGARDISRDAYEALVKKRDGYDLFIDGMTREVACRDRKGKRKYVKLTAKELGILGEYIEAGKPLRPHETKTGKGCNSDLAAIKLLEKVRKKVDVNLRRYQYRFFRLHQNPSDRKLNSYEFSPPKNVTYCMVLPG